ncbi:hypothetical protein GCM10025864_14400 [Luteimicrobium album]|uniref:Uncharacterized protein n=1 Tax=Luteimicrobium album TaxID=1054550 RepID=A0ABQ6HYV9_9MICO|nr:hypothetical protein GCM10025864_14400 [Luteimicrobium album]
MVAADVVLDATETGKLLALAGAEHTVGAESAAETGEPHAPDEPNPDDQQAITWCFAVEDRAGEDHTIAKPHDYETWRDRRWPFWPGSQLSWTDLDPIRLRPRTIRLHEPGLRRDRWTYRRIGARSLLADRSTEQDVTLVNWPQNDCWTRPLVDSTDPTSAQPWYESAAARDAKALSRAFLYWMQTEAPEPTAAPGTRGCSSAPT